MITLPRSKKSKTVKESTKKIKPLKKTLQAQKLLTYPKKEVCTPYSTPLSIILYLIGLIVIIYGAWFRELLWLMLGFVPIIIGIWWAHIVKK